MKWKLKKLNLNLGTFVADENGSNDPLRRYTDKTLVIVLPGDLTVFDIGSIILIIVSIGEFP